MKIRYFLAGYILIWFTGAGFIHAQETLATTGGSFTSSTGSVSFAVGQVAYNTIDNNNTSAYEGVIQPYEIQMVTANRNITDTDASVSLFPNPIINDLTIQITTTVQKNTSYKLYDISGKLLEEKPILKENTKIKFSNRYSGIYLLTIINNNAVVNTFKIVKL